jgi:hypothetical protein
MISEKTVELNITTELVNWTFHILNTRPYILAPSQRAEATLGFDVSVGLPGGNGALIQYKRAHVNTPNEYKFHLNRTTKRDQHMRMFVLELLGFPVYYALPFFHTETEVINYRRRLLFRTKFVRPSRIGLLSNDHHELKYNTVTKIWQVFSDEGVVFEGDLDYDEMLREIESQENANNLSRLLEAYNSVFSNTRMVSIHEHAIESVDEDDNNLTASQVVFAL